MGGERRQDRDVDRCDSRSRRLRRCNIRHGPEASAGRLCAHADRSRQPLSEPRARARHAVRHRCGHRQCIARGRPRDGDGHVHRTQARPFHQRCARSSRRARARYARSAARSLRPFRSRFRFARHGAHVALAAAAHTQRAQGQVRPRARHRRRQRHGRRGAHGGRSGDARRCGFDERGDAARERHGDQRGATRVDGARLRRRRAAGRIGQARHSRRDRPGPGPERMEPRRPRRWNRRRQTDRARCGRA